MNGVHRCSPCNPALAERVDVGEDALVLSATSGTLACRRASAARATRSTDPRDALAHLPQHESGRQPQSRRSRRCRCWSDGDPECRVRSKPAATAREPRSMLVLGQPGPHRGTAVDGASDLESSAEGLDAVNKATQARARVRVRARRSRRRSPRRPHRPPRGARSPRRCGRTRSGRRSSAPPRRRSRPPPRGARAAGRQGRR